MTTRKRSYEPAYYPTLEPEITDTRISTVNHYLNVHELRRVADALNSFLYNGTKKTLFNIPFTDNGGTPYRHISTNQLARDCEPLIYTYVLVSPGAKHLKFTVYGSATNSGADPIKLYPFIHPPRVPKEILEDYDMEVSSPSAYETTFPIHNQYVRQRINGFRLLAVGLVSGTTMDTTTAISGKAIAAADPKYLAFTGTDMTAYKNKIITFSDSDIEPRLIGTAEGSGTTAWKLGTTSALNKSPVEGVTTATVYDAGYIDIDYIALEEIDEIDYGNVDEDEDEVL